MIWRNLCLAAAFAVTGVLAAENLIDAPQKLELERATYRKITIKWEYPADGTQIAGYRIYRDGKEISRSTETVFTDTGVIPGKYYEYSVDAVTTGGKSSDLSAPLKVKTFDSVDFSQHEQVESVVDSLHDMPAKNLTALSLFSAIKAGFESLTGSSLAMNTFDTELISQMISEELEVIKTAVPDWTDAERIAAQAELDACLKEGFGGHSMEQVYIYERLTTLAEAHWEKGNKQAATILYEFSLKFLSDQENCVSSTLNRLSVFKVAHLTAESGADEVEAALAASASERLRFFDFFPDSKGNEARFIYSYLAGQYFRHFPKLLPYDDYREQAFLAARSCAVKQQELFGKVPGNNRLEQIEAWQLIRVKVKLHDAAGNPRRGSIKVANVTADTKPELFPDDPYYEERTFAIDGEAEIPVYAGHVYEITARIAISGGSDLVLNLPSFPQQDDRQIVYDTHGNPVQSPATNGPTAEIVVADSDFPYNLRFERDIDVFTLSWDWVDTADFKAAGFKVFNGNTQVAAVTGNSAANIRLAAPDGNYTYTVAAFDANGQLSRFSVPVTVEPGDQSAHAEFFEWLRQHFGDQPVLSTDDSDGDGVDNYHEFLNGTDPTCAPAPTPADKQVTYTKISLNWECAPELSEGAVWTIRRDGTEVGTSLTASFTDSGLIPGMEYRYTIRGEFANGSGTDWSAPLQLKTQKPETVAYGDKLQQVVDLFNPIELADYTAPSLISAVKSAVEAVTGANITFTVVDESLLEKLVEAEFELLRESTGSMTAAERLTLRSELSQMMAEDFGGNSFEHMYIQSKLAELAEEHWAAYLADRSKTGSRTAAEALYDASLGFMKNHQVTVYSTLYRLAAMQWQALDAESSREEIKEALVRQRDIQLRFFDFFDTVDDESGTVIHPYISILHAYYRYFPVMLAYENYDHEIFDSAMQIRNALAGIETKISTVSLLKKIAAWNLVPLTISSEAAGAAAGTLTLRNVSTRLNYPLVDDDFQDIRTVQLQAGTQSLPVYGGHWYELELVTPVNGGPDWKRVIGPLFFPAGEKVVYDSFAGISRETLPAGTAGATLALKLEQPLAPYNLKAEKLPDALTLSWDWAAPEGFTLDHFKVYRGDTAVGTSATQTLAGIPRVVAEDAAYAYTVTAVSTSGAETRRSPALQVLPDFTEEEKAYFEWKHRYFGDAPTLATDDPDGDGLSNYQEFLLGSNPLVAPPETLPEELQSKRQPGAEVAYYEGNWNYLPDFGKQKPFKSDVVKNFCFAATSGEILTSGLSDHVGAVVTGFFEVPATGKYKFFMSNDDAARLQVDGVTVIENNRPGSPQEYLAEVPLKAGIHSFRLEYVEYESNAKLQINWEGAGFERRSFDGDNVWHYSDGLGQEALEYLQWQRDTDGDGIVDADEMKLGTDWKNKDSDGDGLSDWDEIYQYHTDPTKTDTNGNGLSDYEEALVFGKDPAADLDMMRFEKLAELPGASFVGSLGSWEKSGASAEAAGRRGALEYEAELAEGGILKLVFSLRNRTGNTKDTEIDVYVDDVFCGTRRLEAFGPAVVTPFFHTPYLAAGKHRIRLEWDNYRNAMALVVDRLELFRIKSQAPEPEEQAQLPVRLLKNRSTVSAATESRVSPYCMEGTSFYPGLVRINDSIAASELGSRNWYADVPLAEGENTIAVSFENGGYRQEQKIRWSETNLLKDNPGTLRIRKGDSLRLTAAPAEASEGGWRITGGPAEVNGTAGTAAVQKFDAAGAYTLTGSYTDPAGQVQEATLQLEVVDYQFKRDDVALWQTWKREWDETAAPETVCFSFDDRLRDVAVEKSEKKTAFRVFTDDNQPRYAAARLGENGPVLAVQKISGMGIYSSYQTVLLPGEEYEDGSKEYVMTVVCSPMRSDVELRLNIFVAGVIFDDGTVSKVLRSADFDATGTTEVRFIRSAEVTSSVCHSMSAYQNNEYMGIRKR